MERNELIEQARMALAGRGVEYDTSTWLTRDDMDCTVVAFISNGAESAVYKIDILSRGRFMCHRLAVVEAIPLA